MGILTSIKTWWARRALAKRLKCFSQTMKVHFQGSNQMMLEFQTGGQNVIYYLANKNNLWASTGYCIMGLPAPVREEDLLVILNLITTEINKVKLQ